MKLRKLKLRHYRLFVPVIQHTKYAYVELPVVVFISEELRSKYADI